MSDTPPKPSSRLLQILSEAGPQRVLAAKPMDFGLADAPSFPFLALVGQTEMRLALLLAVVNPAIGGVLLVGPRGTGKTTAVRSLVDLLPDVEVSDCEEGALPHELADPRARLLYPDCYEQFHAGQPIAHTERVKLVELPLNARLDDVVGGINERIAVQQQRVRLERGILSRADNNLLYVDEVNLLADDVTDAILDAAAQGSYSVRRGAMVGVYRARFVLIGSMNPEEGRLRPQILDRFGLRVNVRGLDDATQRLQVYQRVRAYRQNPRTFVGQYAEATAEVREDIVDARARLQETTLTPEALALGIALVQRLSIDSHRAEHTLFEAARAHAAADERMHATADDVRVVAPLALRQRQSPFMDQFFREQQDEDQRIQDQLDGQPVAVDGPVNG